MRYDFLPQEFFEAYRMRATIAFLICATLAQSASAATYKCQDANGNWTEAACTGNATPPAKPVVIDWSSWKPRVGMTAEEVRAAMAAYAKEESQFSLSERLNDKGPAWNDWLGMTPDINRTTSARGVREQWVFRLPGIGGAKYLYFDNGVLTTISE